MGDHPLRGLVQSASEDHVRLQRPVGQRARESAAAGRVQPIVLGFYESTVRAGNIPGFVNWWLTLNQIPSELATPLIQQGMIDYLMNLSLPLDNKV